MPSAAPPDIGTKLRRARIERSLSIEETAWRTRMRPDLLRALELGEFEQIGHQAFVKTHLSSYARFLGMDPAEVVDDFEAMHDEQPSAIAELERQTKEAHKPPRAKWLIAAAVSGAVLLAAGVAGVIGGSEKPQGQVSIPPTVATDTGPVPASEARVNLTLAVLDATTITILADGEDLFHGDLARGARRTFRARDELEIIVADGASVRIAVNGRRLGIPGERGSAFRARFGPNGLIPE